MLKTIEEEAKMFCRSKYMDQKKGQRGDGGKIGQGKQRKQGIKSAQILD